MKFALRCNRYVFQKLRRVALNHSEKYEDSKENKSENRSAELGFCRPTAHRSILLCTPNGTLYKWKSRSTWEYQWYLYALKHERRQSTFLQPLVVRMNHSREETRAENGRSYGNDITVLARKRPGNLPAKSICVRFHLLRCHREAYPRIRAWLGGASPIRVLLIFKPYCKYVRARVEQLFCHLQPEKFRFKFDCNYPSSNSFKL